MTTSQPIYEQKETAKLPDDIQVEKVLLEWTAAARPFKPRTREFYTTIASIAFLCGVILLLLKEFLLIGVIIAFAFLSYVLSTHRPEDATHQLTTKGIRTDGKLYEWENLINFWLESKWDQEVVIARTRTQLPGVILMVIDPKLRAKIIKAIGNKLPLEKPEESFVDKASDWLGKKVPLENN